MSEQEHLATGRTAPAYEVRGLHPDDLGYVQHCWRESHHDSPGCERMPWAAYHRLYTPLINEIIARDDTWILGAYGPYDDRPNAVLGWLAWTPGRLPAVHFAYVRGKLRRRGIFDALLGEARLGQRWLYTFRGSLPAWHKRNAPSKDRVVAAALVRRGVYPTFVDVFEWMEGMR